MLGWLNPFGSKMPRSKYDLYCPRHRYIYGYFDGKDVVMADPMVLYKKVMARGPDIAVHMKVAASRSKDAAKAHESMLRNIREVFVIKPFDEGGLTESETVELLEHFMAYCEDVKKNSNQLSTSLGGTSPFTGTVSSASPEESSSGDPPTKNSSDSGSTENACSTESPPPSPSESA